MNHRLAFAIGFHPWKDAAAGRADFFGWSCGASPSSPLRGYPSVQPELDISLRQPTAPRRRKVSMFRS